MHPLLAKIRIEIPADVAARCSPAELVQLAHQMMQADDLRGMARASAKPVENEHAEVLRSSGPTITLKRRVSRGEADERR